MPRQGTTKSLGRSFASLLGALTVFRNGRGVAEGWSFPQSKVGELAMSSWA